MLFGITRTSPFVSENWRVVARLFVSLWGLVPVWRRISSRFIVRLRLSSGRRPEILSSGIISLLITLIFPPLVFPIFPSWRWRSSSVSSRPALILLVLISSPILIVISPSILVLFLSNVVSFSVVPSLLVSTRFSSSEDRSRIVISEMSFSLLRQIPDFLLLIVPNKCALPIICQSVVRIF